MRTGKMGKGGEQVQNSSYKMSMSGHVVHSMLTIVNNTVFIFEVAK